MSFEAIFSEEDIEKNWFIMENIGQICFECLMFMNFVV